MMSEEEVARKQERLAQLTIRSYDEYSFLPSVATLADYDERRPTTFKRLARRVVIDHWVDPSYVHDVLFYDLARIVGLSERKYYTDQLQAHVTPEPVELNFETVRHHIGEMVQKGIQPTAILLPIELHHQVHTEWDPGWRTLRFGPERLLVEGLELRIFWSNKFMPFRRGYIVSTESGTWTTRPTSPMRLQVIFDRVDRFTMDVTVETIFSFQFTELAAVKAFEILNLPENRLE